MRAIAILIVIVAAVSLAGCAGMPVTSIATCLAAPAACN